MTLRNARAFVLPVALLLTVVLPVAAAPDAAPTPRRPVAAREPAPVLVPMTAAVVAADLPAPTRAAPPAPTVTAPVAATPVRPRPRPEAGTADRRVGPTSGRGWEQRRGAAALSLISYPWQDLGWTISFHPARRGLLGVAYEPDRHIYVFVRRTQSLPALAFTIAHEIGHAYDFTHGTPESRDRWLALRGIDPATPWTGCDGCADLATPAGDFAEVFALWQVGPADFRSRMGPLPTAEELAALSREFRVPERMRAAQ